MTIVDHLFVVLIAIVYPLIGLRSFRRLMRQVRAGQTVDRTAIYRSTALSQWGLFAFAMLLWWQTGRSWPDLGFSFSITPAFWLAAALTVVGISLLIWQVRTVSSASAQELEQLRSGVGDVAVILPRNANELGRFYGLAVTAGIVEEALWRGYLFWYLGFFMPLWAAAVVSTVLFAVGHAYQGAANVPKVAVVGAVFAILYMLSGSLWLPMLMHAAVDWLQGRAAYEVLRQDTDTNGAATVQ